jgi:hypothetical protein
MAIDMALSRAGVVVYDTARGNPVPLDYAVARRGLLPMVVVSGDRDEERILFPPGRSVLGRPTDMSVWEDSFVPGLVGQLTTSHPPPMPSLSLLEKQGDPRQVLLTALALLEAQLRGHDSPEQAPTIVPVAGSRMARLRDFFGSDFDEILSGVRIRHDLLQQFRVPDAEVEAAAAALTRIARSRNAVAP